MGNNITNINDFDRSINDTINSYFFKEIDNFHNIEYCNKLIHLSSKIIKNNVDITIIDEILNRINIKTNDLERKTFLISKYYIKYIHLYAFIYNTFYKKMHTNWKNILNNIPKYNSKKIIYIQNLQKIDKFLKKKRNKYS